MSQAEQPEREYVLSEEELEAVEKGIRSLDSEPKVSLEEAIKYAQEKSRAWIKKKNETA